MVDTENKRLLGSAGSTFPGKGSGVWALRAIGRDGALGPHAFGSPALRYREHIKIPPHLTINID